MNVEGAAERALVLRAQSGDRAAFDELLLSLQGPLYGYISAIVPGFAEDILQDVFILIVRKLRWLNDPALFRAWAYRIASREAFRKLKKQRRAAEDPVGEIEAPEVPPNDPWIRERLMRVAGSLPPASRAVVLLHYFEEMPLAETICLAAFLMTANFHDRLHLLLIFAVGLVYTPLVLGLVALGAYVDKCTLRVLARLDDLR